MASRKINSHEGNRKKIGDTWGHPRKQGDWPVVITANGLMLNTIIKIQETGISQASVGRRLNAYSLQ